VATLEAAERAETAQWAGAEVTAALAEAPEKAAPEE
jgi:hypothetical protein